MPDFRFNPPPGWPVPPVGWTPPPGWQPDPTLPAAPPGWQWWIDARQSQRAPEVPSLPEIPAHTSQAIAPPTNEARVNGAAPAPSLNGLLPSTGSAGLFGRGKKHLEDENAQLRDQIHRLLGLDATALANEAAELRGAVTLLRQEAVTLRSQVDQIRADLVRTSNEAELQEVGIYTYQHPLADAVAYKARLASLSDQIKTWARGDQAVEAATGWTVNGSLAEGKRMVKEYSKLMLRAYNAEADNCVARVQPHRLHTTIERLAKVAQTIEKLGKTMSIRIAPAYHMLRVQEIQLTADYRSKLEEEKERVREERERMREERQAALEFERERARLAKEQAHYQSALAKLVAKGDTSGAADVEEKLREIDGAIASVDAREANIRAGYVYVISNIGAFGPDMVKIGMTRRLEPDDRIRELGDASVPFRFDTHAVIFSEDAVSLESRLHAALATERVNRVNQRREFFYATPARVRELLTDIAGQHLLEYRDVPDALEWRASGARGEVNISEHSS